MNNKPQVYFHLFSIIFQALILVLPLIFIPNIFNPYEFPKFIFFVTAVYLSVVFLVAHWFLRQSSRGIFPKIDFGIFLVLCFGIVNLISDLFGINPTISIWGNTFRRQGFITLICGVVIFFLLRSPLLFSKMLSIFRKTAVISALLLALFTLWQVIQINIFHNNDIPTYNGRIVGTLGNPNFLGGYLAMLLPFVLWYRQKINRLLQIIIISITLLTIFYTDSRAAYAAVLFLFLVYAIRFLLKLRLSRIAVVFFLVLFLLGLFKSIDLLIYKNIAFNDPPPIIKEGGCPESWATKYPLKIITDIHNAIPSFKREAPCDSRFLIWTIGLEALSKQPFLGYGQDNFELAISKAKMHRVDNAHNIFLETAVSSGIVGLLFYLLILFHALRKANFDIKMSLLAFIIVGQFNPLSIAQLALFWILMGFALEIKSKKMLNI